MSHIHDKTEAVFHLMPAPSWLVNSMWVYKYSVNQIPVEEFLSRGNLFLYLLPPKYQDQGPRVIMEAMLAGLPVVASWGYGASDRIIPGTGFTVEGDPLPAIQACADSLVGMTKMGQAAKEHARVAFDPKLWIKELIYGEDTGGLLGNETV
jgi:glycosyltransferase involved in cell wall biosynthesis